MFNLLNHLWRNFKEYLLLIFLITISLYIIANQNSIQTQHLRAIIFGTYSIFIAPFSNLFSLENLKSENEKLRLNNAELMLQLNKLRKDALLIEDLKSFIALKDTFKYDLISSRIVSKYVSDLQETITITGGKKNGIDIGMPVITDRGLVGIVFSVSNNFAIVKTLRNSTISITVMSERTNEHGILKWKEKSLRIINVPKTFNIKRGDRIVVSDLSSIVPIVIPIGVSHSTEYSESGFFNEIIVVPFVDFNKLEYVFVVPVVASKEIRNLQLNLLSKFR